MKRRKVPLLMVLSVRAGNRCGRVEQSLLDVCGRASTTGYDCVVEVADVHRILTSGSNDCQRRENQLRQDSSVKKG